MSGIGFLCKRGQRLASCQRQLHVNQASNQRKLRHADNALQKELPNLTKDQFTDYLQRQLIVWKNADNFWHKSNRQQRVQAERVDKTLSLDFIMSHLRK